MSYVAPQGDVVPLPIAFAYTPPAGNVVDLSMPDGLAEVTGTARFGETVPAGLVIAYALDGVEADRAVPVNGDSIGEYTLDVERGPLLLVAHLFDPAAWQGLWSANTAFAVGDVVFNGSTSESLAVECIAAGTTGGAEPDWSTQVGGVTTDGGVSWETLGRVRDVAPVTNFHIAE